jgi:enoyl-CoA hydratase/carnithine racemase
MHYEHILFERRDDIARLALNLTEGLNSFSLAMHRDLTAPIHSSRT